MKLFKAFTGRRTVFYLLLAISVLIETSASRTGLFGVYPLYILPCLTAGCFFINAKEIAVVSLVCGVLCDMQSLSVGLCAIGYTILIYALSVLIGTVMNRNVVTFAVSAVVLLLLFVFLSFIVYLVIPGKTTLLPGLAITVLPKALLSFVCAMFVYLILRAVRFRFPRFWGGEPQA